MERKKRTKEERKNNKIAFKHEENNECIFESEWVEFWSNKMGFIRNAMTEISVDE